MKNYKSFKVLFLLIFTSLIFSGCSKKDIVIDYDIEFTDTVLGEMIIDSLGLEKLSFAQAEQVQTLTIIGQDIFINEEKEFVEIETPKGLCYSLDQGVTLVPLSAQKKISSLQDLVHFPNIKLLKIYNHPIETLSGLEAMQELEILEITKGKISDISSLANILNLRSLNMKDNDISNIESLGALEGLSHLNFSNNRISDFSVLASLPNLIALTVDNNPLEEYLFVLENLTNLEYLSANNSSLQDMNNLKSLKNLKTLNVKGSNPFDVFALKELKNLKNLSIGDVYIPEELSDLSSLNSLSVSFTRDIDTFDNIYNLDNLESLTIEGQSIEYIPGITNFPNIKKLNIKDTSAKDLSDIKRLTLLEDLTMVVKNEDSSIDFLKPLVNLKKLNILNSSIANFDVLAGSDNIEELILDKVTCKDGPFIDFFPLSNLPLTKLVIENTPIKSTRPIGRMKNLEVLKLDFEKTENISSLRSLVNLKELYLKNYKEKDLNMFSVEGLTVLEIESTTLENIEELLNNELLTRFLLEKAKQVSSIRALTNAKNLKFILIEGTSVDNIQTLSSLKDLEILQLSNNNLKNLSPIEDLDRLKYINVSSNSLIRNYDPIADIIHDK